MHTEKAVILDEKGISRAIARISFEIIEKNKGTANLCLVGIPTRGTDIAKRIAEKIGEIENAQIPVYSLDITPFRDDIPQNVKADLPLDFQTKDKRVVIVDDVMFTGRSVRAAIDGIIKQGRPRTIQLAVLIDRGHRELPIRADYVGKNVPTSMTEQVKVSTKEHDGADKVTILEEA